VARATSHAASRRKLKRRRARDVAGKIDAVGMAQLRSAFLPQVESAWREDAP
jgi:hypothetical protein